MAGINRVVLVGRLTRDPELRKTNNGLSVCSFSLAVDRRPTNGQEAQADFINCIVWRQAGENVARYTHKGSLVGVEGRIQTRKYTDKQGNNRNAFEVVCDTVQFLEPKGNGGGNSSSYSGGQRNTYQETPSTETFNDDASDADTLNIATDDLPF